MSELIFKLIFVILFIIYVLIRVPFDKQYKQQEKIKTVNSVKEKLLLFLLSLGLILIPIVWLFTPFLVGFDIKLPVWARLLGIVISILSLFYFWWIHKTLGVNWSPTLEIRKGHQLIKAGPYKRIRHPMYSQIWLWTIAQFLIISNIFAGLSGILAWTILYFIRVPSEEKMMIEIFGDEYIEYMKQTGRVFPKLN
jgi:protein-S-isoprenylcysteine O-methyltransferase Ste14